MRELKFKAYQENGKSEKIEVVGNVYVERR